MIEKLLGLIPPPLRVYAGIGTILTVLGVFGFVYYRIDRSGYERCETEHTAALQTAKDQAQANVIKVEREYEYRLKELQETPDNDIVVGPITSRVIDGL